MRIVLASSAMGGGGAQKAAVNLAAYFARTGHDVAYFHWGAEDYGGRESMPGVDIVRPSRDGFLSRLFALASLVRKRRPDVVFGFTDVPNVLAFLACRLAASGARVVPGIHSDLRQRDAEVRQGLAERALRVLHRIACRNASAVVAVSGEARRSLIEYYGLPPQRVHGIYNPVLRSVGAATARAGGRGADLVAVGRLTAAKDYPLMIRAVAELVRRGLPVRLTIFGEGEERSSLERLVEAQDLGDRIEIEGFHADEQ
jgi:glycosyltransferase involved in cell wall biosynthesis